MALNMIRLCVGCDTIDDLLDWHRDGAKPWMLHTKMMPKRTDELVDGGSIYRIFKGMILCRQRIISVLKVGDGISSRCEIELDPEIIRVVPTPRRAFQGWRYLDANEAPADLDLGSDNEVPMELARQLREVGAW